MDSTLIWVLYSDVSVWSVSINFGIDWVKWHIRSQLCYCHSCVDTFVTPLALCEKDLERPRTPLTVTKLGTKVFTMSFASGYFTTRVPSTFEILPHPKAVFISESFSSPDVTRKLIPVPLRNNTNNVRLNFDFGPSSLFFFLLFERWFRQSGRHRRLTKSVILEYKLPVKILLVILSLCFEI